MTVPELGVFAPVGRSTAINIANTETAVLSMTLPANSLKVGDTFRIKAMGLVTNTTVASSSIVRVRAGTTTLTGNVAAGCTAALGTTARTTIPFTIEGMVTVLSVGAAGTILGTCWPSMGNVVQPVISAPVTAAVTLDTTAAKLLELTVISGASTTAWNVLSASIVKET